MSDDPMAALSDPVVHVQRDNANPVDLGHRYIVQLDLYTSHPLEADPIGPVLSGIELGAMGAIYRALDGGSSGAQVSLISSSLFKTRMP